jgi:hypothetical protein
LGRGRAEAGQGAAEVGVAHPGQAFARRAPGGKGGQALLGVAVLLEVQTDHGLDARPLVGVEVAAGGEVLGQGPGLVAGPSLEGGDEVALVDQADLEGDQAEEQVAVGGEDGHGACLRGAGGGDVCSAPDVGGVWFGRTGPDEIIP